MAKRWLRLIGIVLVLAFMTSSLSGCGGAVAATVLRIAAVRALISDGNLVKIIADIITGKALASTVAEIISPSGGVTRVTLALNEESGAYECTYTDEAATEDYSVEVTATDTTGKTATSDPIPLEAE
ncbi:MAG: hypothetical protein ABFD49_09575 [Armatimonadota bacterium]|nr:hypothetical protein [bacterium]